jgi:hypothetical protein
LTQLLVFFAVILVAVFVVYRLIMPKGGTY